MSYTLDGLNTDLSDADAHLSIGRLGKYGLVVQ